MASSGVGGVVPTAGSGKNPMKWQVDVFAYIYCSVESFHAIATSKTTFHSEWLVRNSKQ